jgi:exosome complex component RRP46
MKMFLGQYLPALPALLHAALLALLSAAIPLSMTYTSTVLAVDYSSKIIREPSLDDCAKAKSQHVLAFSSKGHLLLNESQGPFDFDTWHRVYEEALSICRESKAVGQDGDVSMEAKHNLENFVRETVEHKIASDYSWSDTAA